MTTTKQYNFFLLPLAMTLALFTHSHKAHAKKDITKSLKECQQYMSQRIKSLQADALRRDKKLKSLETQIKALQAQSGQLTNKHRVLKEHHEQLKAKHKALNKSHQTLNRNYTALQSKHHIHQKKYSDFTRFVRPKLNQVFGRKRKLVCVRYINVINSPVSGKSYVARCKPGLTPVGGGIDTHSVHTSIEINTWTPAGQACKVHGSTGKLTCIATCCRIE